MKLDISEAASELMGLVECVKLCSTKIRDGSVHIRACDLAEINKEAIEVLLNCIDDPVIRQVFAGIYQLYEVHAECEDSLKIE